MVSLLFGKISIVLLLNILVQTESAEIITELTPKFGGSFETPWFCNYTDVSKEMEKLCNLTFELKWTYNGLSSVLNVEFVDSTSPEARLSIGTTKYVAGLIYPHYDNLWYFTPSTRQFNDSATFFWSDVAESEGDLSVTSNLTHFNLKKLASYESLVCSRIGILIFNQRSVDKWTLVYRASSYQLSQFDCPLLDLQVPEAEIFFTPNLAKSRRGLSKRDTDIDRQADMIDFQPLEDSIRVSLDVVKNKTTGGLAWIRNKLHQAKTGYDKFQKETKLNEKIQNSWNNLLEKIKIQRRRRRSADEQFNWRSQLKNFLRFSPFHKSQEDDGHILSDLGLKQPVAIPQISDVIPSTTTQETTTTTTTEPTTTETTTTTTTESTTTTTTTTESTTESTTTTTTTESTTTTTTTEPTTTTTTEETTTTTPITTTENVVVETTVVTTVEPVSSTSKIVELDEQSSVVNAEEDDEIEAKSEPLIGGEEESTTTTTTTTESTTTIELTTTSESTTTTTTTEESTTTTTTTTTEETTTTTEPTTTTTTTTEEPTTTTVEIEFEKTLVESTVEKMEKLAEIERVEEIPSTTTEETTTTTTSTTESTTTTAEIESTTTTEMTTTTSFEEDDETTTPIIIETTSTTTESTTTTTTTEPTTTTTTESTTTTTTTESTTTTTTTEPTTTETTTESTTTTEPSTTTVTSNETSSSDTKIIVLPDNIRMEVTNYTVIDESTGNKTYSLRLHLKGYKWNEGFQNVNSSESQQFMKEKILPLLLKFLNVSQDQLDDVKLLKLSKAAAAAGKGLISRRSIFRRGASAGNDDRFDMDVQFLMRLHH